MPAGATPCAEHGEADFYHTPGPLLPEDLREGVENQGLIQRRCENQTCECVEEPSSTHRRARPPHPLRRSVSLALTEMPGNNCPDFFGIELSMPLVSVPAGGEDLDPLRQTWWRLNITRDIAEVKEAIYSGNDGGPDLRNGSSPLSRILLARASGGEVASLQSLRQ